jgi:hypothetical protein
MVSGMSPLIKRKQIAAPSRNRGPSLIQEKVAADVRRRILARAATQANPAKKNIWKATPNPGSHSLTVSGKQLINKSAAHRTGGNC